MSPEWSKNGCKEEVQTVGLKKNLDMRKSEEEARINQMDEFVPSKGNLGDTLID